MPENLIEAELFGHEAGSFTGAAKTRHGRFEEADGGTLFLDELGTLSMPAQDRLLRATEYGEITRIGASKPISVDVRIVAATNENLPAQVDKGKFRADLLDRLSFEVITLPPLRARQGDIPLLAEHFGRRMGLELEWPNWPGFSPRAMAALEAYHWPGNVRELRNVVERAVYRHEDPERPIDEINVRSVPFALGAGRRGSRCSAAPTAAADATERRRGAALSRRPSAAERHRPTISAAPSRPTSASCSRTRFAETASTSARRPRRSASATTSCATR